MKVMELREALDRLGEMLTSMRAKSAADDLAALSEFLAGYDEESVQGFVRGIRKRLEDKPPPARKSRSKGPDPVVVERYATLLAEAVTGRRELQGVLAQIEGDKAVKLAEIKAITERALGFTITERSRPKALSEFRRLVARELHGQHRLDIA